MASNSSSNSSALDINSLMKALDNDTNAKLMNLTTKKIKEFKLKILSELEFERGVIINLMKKLKDYMYVDEMNELRCGAFIRWINIKDPDNLHLTQGAFLSEIKMGESGIQLCCKNHAHRHFQINMEENIIFQKLSTQESVLLKALDYLDKN